VVLFICMYFVGVKYGWKDPNGYSSMYYFSILGALQLKDKTKISVQELLGKFANKLHKNHFSLQPNFLTEIKLSFATNTVYISVYSRDKNEK
jgi:hypothetical protein